MRVNIEVDKRVVLHSIKLETFVSGESTKENAEILSTKSQADDDNDDVLNGYIATAESRVVDLLSGLLARTESQGNEVLDQDKFIYLLEVPEAFDCNQCRGIAQGIKDFMVNFVLNKWFRATWPEKSRLYQDLIGENILEIKHRLNQRLTPIRRPIRPLGF